MRKLLRDESGLNLVEVAALVLVVLVVIFLLLPLKKGSSQQPADAAAQAQLTTALAKVTALTNDGTIISAAEMGQSGGFRWAADSPPTSPKNIAIGGATSGATVVLCNQSTSMTYFCVKQQSKKKTYGQGASYYYAKLTNESAWK